MIYQFWRHIHVLVLNSTCSISLSLVIIYVPGFIGDVRNEIHNEFNIAFSSYDIWKKSYFLLELFKWQMYWEIIQKSLKSTLCRFIENETWTMLCIVTENISSNLSSWCMYLYTWILKNSYLRHCFNFFLFKDFC